MGVFMKRSNLLAFALIVLLLGITSISAQDDEENLLTNPGFEEPFVAQGGSPVRMVAQGWTPWHLPRTDDMPDYANRQPVYALATDDEPRIWEGEMAQLMYNNTWYTHIGGVYQVVENITPGTELRFQVYVYVWSSAFSDREKSEDDGQVIVQVGIDPMGGTDPTSNNIVWSPGLPQYDAYRPYSVIATAANDTVSVWVRSTVGKPVEYSYIYLDAATLSPTTQTIIFTETPQSTTVAIAPSETTIPTDTEVPPTNTTVPPSNTPVPQTTNTSVPSNTPIPTSTNTDIPPSETPTTDVTQTLPPTNTTSPTNTVMPPPTLPADNIDPTPTREGVSVTNTPTLQATDTSTPTNTEPVIVPTDTPAPTNTPISTGGNTVSPQFRNTLTYVVQRGDTVGRIAILYGSTVEAINAANGLNEDNLIYVNQTLLIPVPLPPPATSTPTPTLTPSVTPEIYPTDVQTTGQGGATLVHMVQRGETLSSIARRYNTTVQAIAQANRITNVNLIYAGQQLAIPTNTPNIAPTPVTTTFGTGGQCLAGAQHVVQPGENLVTITLAYCVSLQNIIQLNGLQPPYVVQVGDVLRIP